MSAAKAVIEARAAGIQIGVEGDDLVLEAAAPPPSAVLNQLSRHKPAIVLLLRAGADGWSAEDWQAFFGERAGIAEFNGHLPRPRAEDAAFEHCVAEWRWRNLTPSEPGRCCMCGCDDDSGDLLLPHGMESTGHAWLHTRCWQPWQDGRRAAAIAALAAAGVYAPGGTR